MGHLHARPSTSGSASCPFSGRKRKLYVNSALLLLIHFYKVEINVNGEVVSGVSMKVGEAGEAFFVVESEVLVTDKSHD